MPPVEKEHIAVSAKTHGWITFSMDGRFAYCESISQDDATILVNRLKTVLPFFLAGETSELIINIRKYLNNKNTVIT
jgi:hypothetical protein